MWGSVANREPCRRWNPTYPVIAPFLSYPEEVRRVISTTNAIESLNYSLQKVTRNRPAFPTTDAAITLCFMAIQNISKKRRQPIKH
ncbi:MAG: transposase [Spirochaetota bacterium]